MPRYTKREEALGGAATDELLAFVAAFAPERGPWRVLDDGAIRNDRDECPICAAVNVATGGGVALKTAAWYALNIGGVFHMVGDDAIRIALAADMRSAPLRRSLLAALGIEDGAP